jgi:hypothetical protein
MKTMKVNQGTVACRVASDDVFPAPAPPMQDVFSAIQNRYQFIAQPQNLGLQMIPGQAPQYAFQGGKFIIGDEAHAIAQLVMEQNGDVITSTSTDIANTIMDDLTNFLDEKFKYKFHSTPQNRSFVSSIIVQFDERFEERISALGAIIEIVNAARSMTDAFQLQRIAFGLGKARRAANPFVQQSQIDVIEAAEYAIERRGNAALSENRYFCSAPLKTADHIRTLEEIEKLLASNK